MNKKTEVETLVLDYDLFDLPTAQHKAGLAGLILMITSMKDRNLSPLPIVEDIGATIARISFTKESLQNLFDDLYDASWVEASFRTKWKQKQPKRTEQNEIEDKHGNKKTEKRFIYDVVKPKGEFLKTLYSGNELWVKLWRDMVWSILRGIPKTRLVYEERAGGEKSSVAENMLNSLRKAGASAQSTGMSTEMVASSLFIGAQAFNAERIQFVGYQKLNFLLHFWTIASLVYVPRELGIDGALVDKGYVLVIPEPASLTSFIPDMKNLLGSLPSQIAGFRPKGALIDIPQEGGLEYLYHLVHFKVIKTDISDSLVALEIYHLDKQGNSIRTLDTERILPDMDVLEDYDALRKDCHNSLFKGQRIKNLMARDAWYTGMNTLFNQYPVPFFVNNKDSPRIPFFGNDVLRKYRALENHVQLINGGGLMNDETGDAHLALCVRRLIREYVYRKSEDKSGVKYEKIKDHKDDKGRIIYPPKYLEALENICRDAFLAMRSRRDNDFVEYFTGSICSVPQYLPQNDYLIVSQSLLSDWERVKTLAMLALSSVSQVGGYSAESEKGEEK